MRPPSSSRQPPFSRHASVLIRMVARGLAALFALTLAEIAARQLWQTSLSISLEYQGYLLIASVLLPQGAVLLSGRALAFGLLADRLPIPWRDAVRLAAGLLSVLASGALAVALWRLALFSLTHAAHSYFPSATALFWPQMLAALGGTGLAVACVTRLLERAVPGIAQQPSEEEGNMPS